MEDQWQGRRTEFAEHFLDGSYCTSVILVATDNRYPVTKSMNTILRPLLVFVLLAAAGFAQSAQIISAPLVEQSLSAAQMSESYSTRFALRLRNLPELRQRVGRGEVLSRAEIAARYLPTAKDWQSVADWATNSGLSVAPASSSRLTVDCVSSVGQLAAALGTGFVRVQSSDGEICTSAAQPPVLDSKISHLVARVLDLQPHLKPFRPQAVTIRQLSGLYINPLTFAEWYNATNLGLDGTGETIVVLGLAKVNPDDLAAFWINCGLPTTLAQFTEVDPLPLQLKPNLFAFEETMDIQSASAMAPGAKIIYLSTLDIPTVTSWLYDRIATDKSIHQITMSFSAPELATDTKTMLQDESPLFPLIAAMGITFFAASGDHGSTTDVWPKVRTGTTPFTTYFDVAGTPTVDYPASDPYVTAVGGSSLQFVWAQPGIAQFPVREAAWCLPDWQSLEASFNYGASTGGISRYFNRPIWQIGTGVPAGSMRLVPDVAALAASNFFPYAYYQGAPNASGGTSLASPMWAGFCALLNQARRQEGLPPLGLLGPKIYPLIGTSAFKQLTTGWLSSTNNPGTNGVYYTDPLYNLVTGLGRPNVGHLVSALVPGYSAPIIAAQPAGLTVFVGSSVTFNISASGRGVLSYQWKKDGTDISGAVSTSYSIASVTSSSAGNFTVNVTNAYGSTVSNAAALSVSGVGPVAAPNSSGGGGGGGAVSSWFINGLALLLLMRQHAQHCRLK